MSHPARWKCAECGYENAAGAAMCNLCGNLKPRPQPAPAPSPPPPVAKPLPREQWDAPHRVTAAPPQMAARPQRAAPGCEVKAEFIALLPLSLIVLTLPGGIANPRARTILRLLLAAMVLLAIVAVPVIVSVALRALGSAQGISGGDLGF